MSQIRRLGPQDFDAYYLCRLAGLSERPAAFTTDADAWRNAPTETIERHLRASEYVPGTAILGAWEGAELVGLLGLSREERRAVAHKARVWGFYVRPEHRRRGIGRALLIDATTMARQVEGLRQLRAVVPTTSFEALSLLENTGFERFGLEQDARYADNMFHDQVYLWHRLR